MKGLSLINRFLSKKVFLECDFDRDFLKKGRQKLKSVEKVKRTNEIEKSATIKTVVGEND